MPQDAAYNNFGIHGADATNAADALAAVKLFVFDEQRLQPDELLAALDADYAGHHVLRNLLARHAPKAGNNDDLADCYLTALFDFLADARESYGRTQRGGILRPGSGSAMYYVWLARIFLRAGPGISGAYYCAPSGRGLDAKWSRAGLFF